MGSQWGAVLETRWARWVTKRGEGYSFNYLSLQGPLPGPLMLLKVMVYLSLQLHSVLDFGHLINLATYIYPCLSVCLSVCLPDHRFDTIVQLLKDRYLLHSR